MDEKLAADCAKRKAQRATAQAAGKTLTKRPRSTYREWLENTGQIKPQERYRPVRDGTRRGVPNGLPIRYLTPGAATQRLNDEKAKRALWAQHKYPGRPTK